MTDNQNNSYPPPNNQYPNNSYPNQYSNNYPSSYPPPPPPPPTSPPGKGMSIASMVLGIISLVLFWFIYLSVPLALIGIILGAISKKKLSEVGAPSGMATAGITTSIIAIALVILIVLIVVACVGAMGSIEVMMDEILRSL